MKQSQSFLEFLYPAASHIKLCHSPRLSHSGKVFGWRVQEETDSSSLVHCPPCSHHSLSRLCTISVCNWKYRSLCKTANGHVCPEIPHGCSLPGILLPFRLYVEKAEQRCPLLPDLDSSLFFS